MTKYERKRNDRIDELRAKPHCGTNGIVKELQYARPNSRKADVSKQNEADVHICYNGRYIAAEVKTTGGRVDALLNGKNKAKFVIYELEFTQKHLATKTRPAWDEFRHVGPVIIPTEIFVAALQKFNALKEMRHNGIVDGIGIQPSSKKLYLWLKEWPVEFHNDWDYTSEDFEGLGL